MDSVGLNIGWRTREKKWERFGLPTFQWTQWLLQSIAVTVVLISLDIHHPVAFSCDSRPGPTPLKTLTKTGVIFRFQVNSLPSRTSQGHRARQKQVYLYMFYLLQKILMQFKYSDWNRWSLCWRQSKIRLAASRWFTSHHVWLLHNLIATLQHSKAFEL